MCSAIHFEKRLTCRPQRGGVARAVEVRLAKAVTLGPAAQGRPSVASLFHEVVHSALWPRLICARYTPVCVPSR